MFNVPPEKFALRAGEEVLVDYQFGKKTIHHLFCPQCGVGSFSRGTGPDMPWPVHKAQMLGPWCPVQADWILARVYEPPADQAPRERTAREELAEGVRRAADALLPSPVALGVGALAVLGIWTIGRLLRR